MTRRGLFLAVSAVTALVAAGAWAGAVTTERVSVKSNGDEVDAESTDSALSASGRYVAFASTAAFVGVDGNDAEDVYLHDRESGKTKRMSVKSNGDEVSESSGSPALSATARYIAFEGNGALVGADGNGTTDIYVHDRGTGATRRVSVKSNGDEVSDGNFNPAISADGRSVAFVATGPLVGTDDNGHDDVYVHDRQTGKTTRVSVRSNGGEVSGHSGQPTISANGRFVGFECEGPLAAADDNGQYDVYVHDRHTGRTKRVSVKSSGQEVSAESRGASISASGRLVVFDSAGALVGADGNGVEDVYVHDRETGKTRRVSVKSNGAEVATGSSREAAISGTGRFVAFESNGVFTGTDDNETADIYVHDRRTGKTRRVSLTSAGDELSSGSFEPAIPADGSLVVFESDGPFVDSDMNGLYDIYVRGPLF